jgi:hypothetical protein
MNGLVTPFPLVRFETADTPAPRKSWGDPEILSGTEHAIMFNNLRCPNYFYAPRLPRVYRFQIINHQTHTFTAVSDALVLSSPEEDILAVTSYIEVSAVKFETHRHDIGLTVA